MEVVNDRYDVKHGLIANPGKFEGEPLYVPYFYDYVLNGFSNPIYADTNEDEDEDVESELLGYSVFIDEDDIKQFPELKGYSQIELFYSNDGFITHQLIG